MFLGRILINTLILKFYNSYNWLIQINQAFKVNIGLNIWKVHIEINQVCSMIFNQHNKIHDGPTQIWLTAYFLFTEVELNWNYLITSITYMYIMFSSYWKDQHDYKSTIQVYRSFGVQYKWSSYPYQYMYNKVCTLTLSKNTEVDKLI